MDQDNVMVPEGTTDAPAMPAQEPAPAMPAEEPQMPETPAEAPVA